MLLNKSKKFIISAIKMFFSNEILISAASLAYSFLFTIFPLMILISQIIAYLNITNDIFNEIISKFMPDAITDLSKNYVDFLKTSGGSGLMWTGISMTAVSATMSIRKIIIKINKMYHEQMRRGLLKKIVVSVFLTASMLVMLIVSLAIMLSGRRMLELFGINNRYGNIWIFVRFVILAILVLISLLMLYHFAVNTNKKLTASLPGAVTAMVAWVAASAMFSYYIENFGNYAKIYGYISSFIILMIWLYITAAIILTGGLINVVNNDQLSNAQTAEKKG